MPVSMEDIEGHVCAEEAHHDYLQKLRDAAEEEQYKKIHNGISNKRERLQCKKC